MQRLKKGMLAGLFLLVLVLPWVQKGLRNWVALARDLPLGGYAPPPERPVVSWESVTSERFQSDFQGWFSANVGLRAHMARTDSTINYYLFGDGRLEIVKGRDDYLFERAYIIDRNRPGNANTAVAQAVARDLRRIGDRLHAQHVELIMLISPSKAVVYPDKIPPSWERTALEAKQGHPTKYEEEVTALRDYGVSTVDAQQLLVTWRQARPDVPWFSRGGTHWSFVGACDVMTTLLATWQTRSSLPVPALTCANGPRHEEARGSDQDLASGLNLWFDRPIVRDTPMVRASLVHRVGAERRILFVGSSFSETLMRILSMAGVANVDRYYYYRRFDDHAGANTPIDRADPHWATQVLSYDLVVLEATSVHGLEHDYVREFVSDMLTLEQ